MKIWAHFDFFYKRNINKNILFRRRRNRITKRTIIFIFAVILLAMPYGLSSCSQGKDVNKRRIENEKARKDKEARKKYEQAIKQHEKNQSAMTRSMMKQTKKESPKNTPLKKSSGKKCK
jgi:hypothetical protein